MKEKDIGGVIVTLGPVVLFLAGCLVFFISWIAGSIMVGLAIVLGLIGVTSDIGGFAANSVDKWSRDGTK